MHMHVSVGLWAVCLRVWLKCERACDMSDMRWQARLFCTYFSRVGRNWAIRLIDACKQEDPCIRPLKCEFIQLRASARGGPHTEKKQMI